MARTFDISDTERSDARLPGLSPAELLEERGLSKLEATSISDAPLVQAPPVHGLLAATHLAFARHLPLLFSPDAVWIAIAQGLARHVDANAEALRSALVRHQGQIEVEVRRDDFVMGRKNDWASAIDELSQLLRPHLGGRRDLFVAGFSTTTEETRVASEVALLSGMQRFFTYSVDTLCGIPSIVLEGTPDDWASIEKRVAALGEFGLTDWVRVLRPVVVQLHASSRGEVNREFWQRIYKPIEASGGDQVVGWINAFFPFLNDEGTEPNPAIDGSMDGQLDAEPSAAPNLGAFPTGLSHAPFLWKYRDEEIPLSLCAGAFGVEQDARGVLRPRFGWAVAPRMGRRRFVAHRGEDTLSFSPIAPEMTESLVGLGAETEGIGPFDLSLGWCEQLRSLEGAAGTELASIHIVECNRLATLDPLRAMTGLRELSVSQCSGLRDISALATLTGLKRLTLVHLPNVTDLRVISDLRGLESLGLWDLPALPAAAAQRGRWNAESIARVLQALRAGS